MGCLKLHIIEEEFLQKSGSSIPLKHNIVFDKNDSKHCISDDIGCGECYRYSFNGKEQDPETSGNGNSYDYGFRIYNPRIAKFLSVDPLTKEFPWNSTYCFAENDVIRSIDLDGEEKKVVIYSSTARVNIIQKMEEGDFKSSWNKILYCMNNGWVNNQGSPSNFIHRDYKALHGDNRVWRIPSYASAEILPNSKDLPGKEDNHKNDYSTKYGSYELGGGWYEIYYFEYFTQQSVFLGIIPNAKTNENFETAFYKTTDEELLNVTPTFKQCDNEWWSRIALATNDIAFFLMNKRSMPFSLSYDQADYYKKIRVLKGKLRTIGPNSKVMGEYQEGDKKGYFTLKYTIDESGNESFDFKPVLLDDYSNIKIQ
jgi:RHS repeat-associated protein